MRMHGEARREDAIHRFVLARPAPAVALSFVTGLVGCTSNISTNVAQPPARRRGSTHPAARDHGDRFPLVGPAQGLGDDVSHRELRSALYQQDPQFLDCSSDRKLPSSVAGWQGSFVSLSLTRYRQLEFRPPQTRSRGSAGKMQIQLTDNCSGQGSVLPKRSRRRGGGRTSGGGHSWGFLGIPIRFEHRGHPRG